MKIKHNIVTKRRSQTRDLNVDVSIYSHAALLWDELELYGFIERMKSIPQLGYIKTYKNERKSRFDYVMLQLYLHQFAFEELVGEHKYSYNNSISRSTFHEYFPFVTTRSSPTIMEVIQIFVVSYNIGHFDLTFTSSRGIILYLQKNSVACNDYISMFDMQIHKDCAKKMIEENDYLRFHLLNSILMLSKCDVSKPEVALAINVISDYIIGESSNEKQLYIFDIFKKVRDFAYLVYDLEVTSVPFYIDIKNKKELKFILRELLAAYNNKDDVTSLLSSVQKLLSDTIYCKPTNTILSYKCSQKISRNLTLDNVRFSNRSQYINEILKNKLHHLNKPYTHHIDFDEEYTLKVTFDNDEAIDVYKFGEELSKMNFVNVSTYSRKSNKMKTVIVSISKKCQNKTEVAFKIFSKLLNKVYSVSDKIDDPRYIVISKYFLFYLFGKRNLRIFGQLDENKCVIVTRGKNARVKVIRDVINNSKCKDPDKIHEVEFMRDCLERDLKNDLGVMIPSSICVYESNDKHKCEFDGLVIFPNRNINQLLFLEAKNINEKPSLSVNCLAEKFVKIGLDFEIRKIKNKEFDCYMEYSIKQYKK